MKNGRVNSIVSTNSGLNFPTGTVGGHRGSAQTITTPNGEDNTSRETGTCATAGFPELSMGFGDPTYHMSRDTHGVVYKDSSSTRGLQSRAGNYI